ncbi:MAG: ABC transporter permease [Planktomarina sp.]
MSDQTSSFARPVRGINRWIVLGGGVAAMVIFPIAVVFWLALFPTENIWPHLLDTVLPRYAWNTAVVMLSVGAGTMVLGTGLAYLVTHHLFPGRGWLQYALLAPLAVPGYVGAYALVDFLEYAGPVQTGLRDVFGWQTSRDYWFPQIRSMGSAIFVLTVTLYPYVYLLARASFRALTAGGQDVARSMGLSPFQRFWRVSVPLARAGIVAGTAVVMMETVNDFGTVDFFAVQTLTTGIFSVWLESYNTGGAAQLALCSLIVIAALAGVERSSRRRAEYANSARQVKRIQPVATRYGWICTVCCLLPFLLGFIAPVSILIGTSEGFADMNKGFFSAFLNSFTLGALTAVFTLMLALLLVHGLRHRKSNGRRSSVLIRITGLGYAIPGAVLGLGVLIPLAALDRSVATIWSDLTGERLGLLLTGTGFALVFAYTVRFFAIAVGAAEAGYGAIPVSLSQVARSLGLGSGATLRRVFAPLMRGTVASAMLLVFVDTVKELPATLLLRPFNFQTLATYTYDQASLENLAGAAPGALMIVALSLGAVLLLAKLNK